MKRVTGILVFLLGSIITCSGGPGGGDTTSSSSSSGGQVAEPIYGGTTTDEAWLDMVDSDRNTTESATWGASIVVPTEGASMAPGTPPTFVWTTPLAMNDVPGRGGDVRHVRAPVPWKVDFISTALAHGDPVTGPVHWLKFTMPGGDPIHVFTTLTSWEPLQADWDTFSATGGAEIRLSITSAFMTQNRVTQGPYRAPGVRRFRVQ